MWYVEVLIADSGFHKNEPLTYASKERPEIGRIVVVPIQKRQVLGVVVTLVAKPAFKTKAIIEMPDIPPLPAALLGLLQWMRDYYPGPLGVTTQLFLTSGLTKKLSEMRPKADAQKSSLPPLTEDQRKAIANIKEPGLHLLHGETGSGKTRVYIELARQRLRQNQSALILTPEISLTSQLAQTFRSVFGDRVTIMHSGLTDASRRQAWLQILRDEEPLIVIGARSALFSPIANLGLIVVDEAHEPAYKQDQSPYYHASVVAAKLAALHNCTLVLGSATPLVSDYFIASSKHRPIIRMSQLATGVSTKDPSVKIIDLKDRSLFGKSQIISNVLLNSVGTCLQNNEQVLLFLNRRGTARIIFCERCGWQATCPHCDLPLVYHGDQHRMLCHSCSFRTSCPNSCPECTHTNIVFRSIGTKAVAEEVQRLFPDAHVMRFDTDNKKSERLETHYDAVHSGQIDVLVGTQMLAKGLDLPKLGLVGVIIADTSLYFPDFTAQERTYQLLRQVLGRIGRGHRQSSAVIQTYSPDSVLLASVLQKNWSDFYNNELQERRQFLFPPFCYILKLVCRRATDASAQKTAERLAQKLRSLNNKVMIEGPAPSFHGKIQNKFAWQIIVKSKSRKNLTDIIAELPSGWLYDIDPTNLL